MARPLAEQRSFDDLGAPLYDVTFCVVDLETTGGSPHDCAITEVGAAKFRGGECLGTLQTLVNPGCSIPPAITILTGITEAMVIPAPPITEVLPALLEFIGDAVIIGHNIRFDVAFLNAALAGAGRRPLTNRTADTLALARRLVAEEAPNHRLDTLARVFRLDHRPTHRALDDVLATADLLHVMLERAAGLGVTGLDDLLALPRMGGHPQAGKLSLTSHLPRSPGVYLFRDRRGQVLYVGKAANLRARVRSYFSTDTRRKVGNLLREAASVDHEVCVNALHAAVREVRLIHEHQPRYNRQAKDWSRYCWVKLSLAEPFPRLVVARVARADGALYLGPLSSQRHAQRVIDAIHTTTRLRRCSLRVSPDAARAPCTPAQLGVAACPCSGATSAADYRAVVDDAVAGLTTEPERLLERLRARIRTLAEAERFEEAADMRDRADSLCTALRRQRLLTGLWRSGHTVVDWPGHGGAELERGQLLRVWGPDEQPPLLPIAPGALPIETAGPADLIPKERVDELLCVASWLDQRANRLRLASCSGTLASDLPAVPRFQPRPAA
jgi:DNA polymerase-3 subunit epsilon